MILATPNPTGALFCTMVIVAFTCKLLDVIRIVVNIVTINAFFIDWEQVPLYTLYVSRKYAAVIDVC